MVIFLILKNSLIFRILEIRTSVGGVKFQENRPALLEGLQNRTIKIAKLNTLRCNFIFKMDEFDDVQFPISTVLKFAKMGWRKFTGTGVGIGEF